MHRGAGNASRLHSRQSARRSTTMSARERACADAADNPALHCADYDANARGADDLVRAPPPAHVDGNDIPADAAWHPRRWSYLDAAPDRRAPLFVREPEGEARVVAL